MSNVDSCSVLTEYDVLVKGIVIGDAGVGKSSLLRRYIKDSYQPEYTNTIGVDFHVQTLQQDGKFIKLQLWDTAGQERFRTITTSYYRGAHVVMLIYDVTDRSTFESVPNWVRELSTFVSDVPLLLIANKCDLGSMRTVSSQEGSEMASTIGAPYLETSARSAQGVNAAFSTLAATALPYRLQQMGKLGIETNTDGKHGAHVINIDDGEQIRSKSCLRRFVTLFSCGNIDGW